MINGGNVYYQPLVGIIHGLYDDDGVRRFAADLFEQVGEFFFGLIQAAPDFGAQKFVVERVFERFEKPVDARFVAESYKRFGVFPEYAHAEILVQRQEPVAHGVEHVVAAYRDGDEIGVFDIYAVELRKQVVGLVPFYRVIAVIAFAAHSREQRAVAFAFGVVERVARSDGIAQRHVDEIAVRQIHGFGLGFGIISYGVRLPVRRPADIGQRGVLAVLFGAFFDFFFA